jgi:hypothetical protein
MALACFEQAGFKVSRSYFPKNQVLRLLQVHYPVRVEFCLAGLRKGHRNPELELSDISQIEVNDNFLSIDFTLEFISGGVPYIIAVDVTGLDPESKKERTGYKGNLIDVYKQLGIYCFINLSVFFLEEGWHSLEDFQREDLINQVYILIEEALEEEDFILYKTLEITLRED